MVGMKNALVLVQAFVLFILFYYIYILQRKSYEMDKKIDAEFFTEIFVLSSLSQKRGMMAIQFYPTSKSGRILIKFDK